MAQIKFYSDLNLVNSKILNHPQPTSSGDLVVKSYVDSKVPDPVAGIITSQIDLLDIPDPLFSFSVGDRILLNNQADSADNEVYVYTDVDTLTKVSSGAEGRLVYNIPDQKLYIKESTNWVELVTAGSGGSVDFATQAEVDAGTVDNKAISPDTLANSSLIIRKYVETLSSTGDSFGVVHNLNTTDVVVSVYYQGELMATSVTLVDADTVSLDFSEPVDGSNIKVVVIG